MEFRTTGTILVQISRRSGDAPDELLFSAIGEDVSVSDAFTGFLIIKVKRPPEKVVVIEATEREKQRHGKL